MKGHVLHRARAHLKVPGCSLVLNALLTKKLPMFLSRLNEINGGCEKILPVSGSFWSNLKFLKMMDFTAWLWGWNVRVDGILLLFSFWDVCSADQLPINLLGAMMACLNNRGRISTFVEKIAHFLWFVNLFVKSVWSVAKPPRHTTKARPFYSEQLNTLSFARCFPAHTHSRGSRMYMPLSVRTLP